jgi:hypothetical protein
VGENTGAGACARWGYHQPFDLATLNALYPSRSGYLDAVERVTRENVRRGFLLKPDAEATLAEARRSSVGKDHRSSDDDDDDD